MLIVARCALSAVLVSLFVQSELQAQRAPVVRQFRADSFYIREWVRGGSREPDFLVEPRQLAVTQSAVIVLDMGTREVHALDLKTGAKRFVLKASGEGPGEFKRPMHIATTAQLVGVLDAATSRITIYSDSGRFLWTTRVPDGSVVETMCMLPRGVVRVKYLGALNAIAMIDSSGRTMSRTSLPVTAALQKAPSFANSAFIADGCVGETMAVAPFFGGVWYSLAANGSARRFPYIEAGQEAVVTSKQRRLEKTATHVTTQTTMTTDVDVITRGAMQHGDTVMIEAAATKVTPFRILDYYRASDGMYLYSRRLPLIPTALAISPTGQLIAASIGNETSLIVSLTTTKLTPSEITKQRQKKQ